MWPRLVRGFFVSAYLGVAAVRDCAQAVPAWLQQSAARPS